MGDLEHAFSEFGRVVERATRKQTSSRTVSVPDRERAQIVLRAAKGRPAAQIAEVTDACYPRHRGVEFLQFLKLVAKAYPCRQLHVVVDNYYGRSTAALSRPTDGARWQAPAPTASPPGPTVPFTMTAGCPG